MIDLSKQISFFTNITQSKNPSGTITVEQLLSNIKNGTYSKVITARKYYNENIEKYKEYKVNHIPCVTFSGKFNTRNLNGFDSINDLTGLIQIDFDNIPIDKVEQLNQNVINDKFTQFAFLSLSGSAIKAFIKIDINKHLDNENFNKNFYPKIESYYYNLTGFQIDSKCKDLTRLCLVSIDNNLFINENAIDFDFDNIEVITPEQTTPETTDQRPEQLTNKSLTPETRAINTTKTTFKESTNNLKNSNNNINIFELFHNDITISELTEILLNANWTIHKQDSKQIELTRPDKKKGLSGTLFKDTKIFSVFSNNTDLPIKSKQGYNPFELLQHYKFNNSKKETIKYINSLYTDNTPQKTFKQVNKTTGELITIDLPFCFWFEIANNLKGLELKISIDLILQFLITQNYRLLKNDKSGLTYRYVAITDNIVNESTEQLIRNSLLNKYLKLLPYQISENFCKPDLQTKLINSVQQLDKVKLGLLPFENIDFSKDNATTSYFYFNNGFVQITEKSIEVKQYKDLKGLVWESQKIKHEISIENDKEKIRNFEFYKFLKNVCTNKENNTFDSNRFISLVNCIGYLLHDYQNMSYRKAIIFTESSLNDLDIASGGTGKSLILLAISYLRKVCTLDGKAFKHENNFVFQTVNLDDKIIYLDDTLKDFDFENLFSSITSGLSVEKKNKDKFTFEIENSPKFAISTNYTIKKNNSSANRRKFEMELLTYYGFEHRPINDFGNEFFSSWNFEQWNLFYNVMFLCVMDFLENKEIPTYESNTIKTKKLNVETNETFIEFMSSLDNEYYNTLFVCNEFYDCYYEFAQCKYDKDRPKGYTIGLWLQIYCTYNNIILSKNLQKRTDNGIKKCYKMTKTNLVQLDF